MGRRSLADVVCFVLCNRRFEVGEIENPDKVGAVLKVLLGTPGARERFPAAWEDAVLYHQKLKGNKRPGKG